ncbi:MAG TPA: 16S rRNA (cytosine(1402)-N(4))-methyltransferase [Succinivibrionaceae bacterium]|nr:16S rRNA (cytosine(1402)-N(4))-methyltransferase [Succinivibrionaceae bacterium]
MSFNHVPVLLQEVLAALAIKEDGIYLDATFGRGGHSKEILKRLGTSGRLYALDRDPEAVKAAGEIEDGRFCIVHRAFSELKEVCDSLDITGRVDGILMDIGVSSPQIDDAKRGFSFDRDGPLDMRMNPEDQVSAADIVNKSSRDELSRIFKVYGEENFASKIAGAIVREREKKPFTTTLELAGLIDRTVPSRNMHKNKATRCFQALRIAVNRELTELEQGLCGAVDVLAPHGRLCVITFHSLEDRIVKNFIKERSQGQKVPNGLPITFEESEKLRLATATLESEGGPVKAGPQELKLNVRSRSATLRTASKLSRLD